MHFGLAMVKLGSICIVVLLCGLIALYSKAHFVVLLHTLSAKANFP